MNKKILGTILSTGIILTSGVILTACGGGDNTEPQKNILNVSFSVANHQYDTIYDQATNTFTFEKGSQINFSKNDFTVTVTYTDGTSEVYSSDNFNLDVSNIPSSNPEIGDYSIIISVGNDNTYTQVYNVRVVAQKIDGIVGGSQTVTFTYDSTSKNIIEKIDEMQVAANKMTLSQLQNMGYVTVTSDDSYTQTEVGTYSLRVNPVTGYEFESGESEVWITWQIEKIKLPLPQLKINGQIVEDPENIKLDFMHQLNASGEYEPVMQEIELDFGPEFTQDLINQVVVVEGNRAEDSGYHSIYMNINENYQDHYTFDIVGFDYIDQFVEGWEILPMRIRRPEIENGNNHHYTYAPGQTIEPEIDFHDLDELFEISGTTSATEASDYSYRIDAYMKNNYYSSYNYVWEDGSQIDTTYFDYYIDKANYVLPDDIDEKIVLETMFYEDLSTGVIVFNETLTQASREYLENKGMLIDGAYFEFTEETDLDHATLENEYFDVKCIYRRNYNNYNPSEEITVHIKVNKQPVEISNIYWTGQDSVRYDGTSKTRIISSFSASSQTGADANVRIGNVGYYYKASENDQEIQVDTCVNAGFYRAVVTFVCDSNYIITNNTDDFENEWEIQKRYIYTRGEWGIGGTFGNHQYGANINYSFYTGQNKTIVYTPEAHYNTYYDNNNVNETIYVEDDFIAITYSHQYKANPSDTWIDLGENPDLSRIGYYKTTINSEIASLEDRINCVLDGQKDFVIEWEILGTTIDCSNLEWENITEVEYTGQEGVAPKIVSLPKGLSVYYTYTNITTGSSYGSTEMTSIGRYTITANFYPKEVDGSENVQVHQNMKTFDENSVEQFLVYDKNAYIDNGIIGLKYVDPVTGFEYVVNGLDYTYIAGATSWGDVAYGSYVSLTREVEFENTRKLYYKDYKIVKTLTEDDFEWDYEGPFEWDGNVHSVRLRYIGGGMQYFTLPIVYSGVYDDEKNADLHAVATIYRVNPVVVKSIQTDENDNIVSAVLSYTNDQGVEYTATVSSYQQVSNFSQLQVGDRVNLNQDTTFESDLAHPERHVLITASGSYMSEFIRFEDGVDSLVFELDWGFEL